MRRALLLSLLLPCAAAARAPAVPCEQRVLAELGWRFEPADVPALQVHAGAPCTRADLAEAHAAGDLRVALPRDPQRAAAQGDAIAALLEHPATRCAYAYRLGAATRRAADRLAANPGYRFSGLQLGWIGFGRGGARADGWRPIFGFGRGFVPSGRNSTAIEAFYRGRVRSECGVGRQVAQYAAQYELYGADAFDREFAADELAIGTFVRLHDTRSILLGDAAGELAEDPLGVAAAALGRQAFAGRPGYVVHVFDRRHLDDLNNQAENFVVYDVSREAAEALRARGGLAATNARSREIWRLARELGLRGHRLHERLLYERDPVLRRRLDPRQRALVARLDALLDDPVLRGFRIYVHPRGVRPLAYHVVRLLDRNPRTPFRTELAPHNLHGALMHRYLQRRLADCAAAR